MTFPMVPAIDFWSGVVARSLFAGLWEGVLLAGVVGAGIRLAPRMPAAVRFLVWAMTYLVLAALPFLHAGTGAVGPGAGSPVVRLAAGWSVVLAAFWLGASVVRGAELVSQIYRLHGLWRGAKPVDVELDKELLRVRGRRRVELCTSTDVDRPSVIGFFLPRILLPGWLLEGVGREELEQIVMHEMEHLRRRDDWVNLLQKLALVAFPLNPALLWIERRLCVEREVACDDGVLARTGAPRAYASCLANLAEQSMYRRMLSLSLGAMEGRSELARRVYRILRREERMRPWQQCAVAVAMMAVLVAGATGLAYCPELVAFGGASRVQATESAAAHAPAVVEARQTATMVKAVVGARRVAVVRRSAGGQHLPAARLVSLRRRQADRGAAGEWLVVGSGYAGSGYAGAGYVGAGYLPVQTRMVLTVFHDQGFSSSYAAVPTGAGWLLIQL